MLHDAILPAPAATAGVKLMLQKMQQHDGEIALHGLLRADAQILDLLDQVDDIEVFQGPLPQETRLFFDPTVEVALIERLTFVGQWVRACHVTASPRLELSF
jgi:hypothetical protein